MTTDLVVPQDLDLMTLGKVLAQSGYFQDTKDAAQAIVKVLSGRESGFGPIASMTGINIVKGKVSWGANLIGAAVKRSGRYDYRVKELTEHGCTIEFFEHGKSIGVSTFNDEDARKAGLVDGNWTRYRRNMMFARAISNGVKWYCPDVTNGPVYTPDELGAVVDGETGEIIDMVPTMPTPMPEPAKAKPAPTNGDSKPTSAPARPLAAEAIRDVCRRKAGWSSGVRAMGKAISEGQTVTVVQLMGAALHVGDVSGDIMDHQRHDVLDYLYGVRSTGALTTAEASAIISWLKSADEESWELNDYARAEIAAVLSAVAVAAGQQVLL